MMSELQLIVAQRGWLFNWTVCWEAFSNTAQYYWPSWGRLTDVCVQSRNPRLPKKETSVD
jgi:hypothetical protein